MVQSEEIGPFEFQKLSHFQNMVKWKKRIWWEWVVWIRIKKLIFHINSLALKQRLVETGKLCSKSQCNVHVFLIGLSNKHDDLLIPQYALSKKSNYLQLLNAPLPLKSCQKDKIINISLNSRLSSPIHSFPQGY